MAAGLVAKFPGEDGGAGFVAIDDEGDVGSVGGLGGRRGVECGRVAGEDGAVGIYPAQVVPVVQHGEDKGYAVSFSGRYHGVETSDTLGAGSRSGSRIKKSIGKEWVEIPLEAVLI